MKAYSIHRIILVIVCSLIVPGFAIGIAASYNSYLDQQQLIKSQALQAARALLLDVDAEFKALNSTAAALATSPALQPGQLGAFYEQARQITRESAVSRLVLTDAAGVQLLDTDQPFGTPLSRHDSPALLERAAMAGQAVVSNLYPGKGSGRHLMSLCLPVWRGAALAYFIDAGVDAGRFSSLLTSRRLPPDWVIAILDASGTIVARNHNEDKFVGAKGTRQLLHEINGNREGEAEVVTLEGLPVLTLYSHSLQSGWNAAVGIPLASLREPLWSLLAVHLGLSLLLLGLGLGLASLAAAYIQRSLRHLVALSGQIGHGQPLAPPRLRLVEAQQIANAMAGAAARLQQSEQARDRAEAALQQINADLERHVQARTAELQQSRSLLATIVEYMPAMLFVKRADDLRYLMLNRHGERLLECSREAVLGRNDIDLLGEQQGKARMAAAQQALQAETAVHTDEEALRLPSGTLRYLRTHRIALRDASGKATHLLGISLDITANKLAEEQLRIAAVAFESQEAMLITDERNVIVQVNKAFSASSGYSAEESIGRTPSMFQSGRHDAAFYAEMWDAIHHQGMWQGELWDRRKNSEIYPTWTTISAIRDRQGHIRNYVCTQTDISARKQAEEEIRRLAFFDPLTGLPNRRLLLDRLRHVVDCAARNAQYSALMFIDLDNFKLLNDTLGHDQGDCLLQQVAARLPGCVRAGDTVARLGGDEFVVMLEELGQDSGQAALRAQAIGEHILNELNQPYPLAERSCRCSPSIGVTMFSDRHVGVDDLLKRADLAMYQAKAQGRNTLRFFEPGMQALVESQAQMEQELHEALERNEFELYYQAQVTAEGRITGAEALLRWNHGRRGVVEPEQFIGLAEKCGFILPLGLWVLRQACRQLAAWAALPSMAGLSIAINVSSRQFLQPDFVAQVFETLEHSGADANKLKLELTESLLLDDVGKVAGTMQALKQRGIGLALDDFGTGYSSLSYLKRLPLDQLKIDRSFSRDLLSDPNDAAIARIIVTLGHTLGLSIIAEGIETEDQRSFLAAQDCTVYQGFLFSPPLAERAFRELVDVSLGRQWRGGIAFQASS